MNKRIPGVISLMLLAFTASAANWVYDPNAGTITDGDWTFAANVSGTDLTVGTYSAYPTAVSDLDFGKPIKSADGNTTYTLFKLNPAFNNNAAGKRIGKLLLPETGLKIIGVNAFNQCTALTNIVNYVPDSVTNILSYAFYKCPAKQALRVYGVARFGRQSPTDHFSNGAFNSSGITSVTFGPDFKEINDWDNGPFSSCTSLTNVTFHPATSGASFTGGRNGGFNGCTSLAGTIDLSGFSDLTYLGTVGGSGRALGNTKIDTVILGAGLLKIHGQFFDQMTYLKKVVFNSSPATTTLTAGSVMFGGLSATQPVATYIPAGHKSAWAAYARNGILNSDDSTWSETWAGSNYAQRYLLTDEASTFGGPLGDWVFDDATGLVTNELWSFNASRVVRSITIGSCTRYPAAVSLLDFTTSITDTNGVPLSVIALNTAFSSGTAGGTQSTAGQSVGKLCLPEGVISLGAGAFGMCLNLTNVVNFIPDSVTTIGVGVFRQAATPQDVRMCNVSYVNQACFYRSKITSVYFGPAMKTIRDWDHAPFYQCTSMTNVTFDPAISGAEFSGIRSGGFIGCINLTGTLDLRGFSNLGYVSDYGKKTGVFSGTRYDTILLGSGLSTLAGRFFNDMPSLKCVIFEGNPPATMSGTWNSVSFGQMYEYIDNAQTVKTFIYKANKDAWAPYSASGSVDGRRSTWAEDYVASGIVLSYRPLLLIDPPPEGTLVLIR